MASSGPYNYPEYGPFIVQNDKDHAVLYVLPYAHGNTDRPPSPVPGKDLWDQDHVKMPCSVNNTYVEEGFFKKSESPRWPLIKIALKKKIANSFDLEKAILKYNPKFQGIWKFDALHLFFSECLPLHRSKQFFEDLLLKMIELALDLPNLIQAPIPLLKKNTNKSISLTQQQIASLLANAFFCTFPMRNTRTPGTLFANYPKINFISIYGSADYDDAKEKLKCIIHYFKRVCDSMPTGVVTFSRRQVDNWDCPNWKFSKVPIDVPVTVNAITPIEEMDGMIQVDFANKFLGVGVLGRGLVQNEIRCLICPELIVSMLFTEALGDNEAVMVLGCERYSNYTGYGRRSFKWAGDYSETAQLDASRRRRTAILAIDAVKFHKRNDQYNKYSIERELNKAWIGFSFFSNPDATYPQMPFVATGNWGCGAFGGDPELKSLIQIMAAAQAQRRLSYHTFGDEQLKKYVESFYEVFKKYKVTVGDLHNNLTNYNCYRGSLSSFLSSKYKDLMPNNFDPDEYFQVNQYSSFSSQYSGNPLLNRYNQH